MKSSVYLIIAHGSKAKESNDAFFEFLEKFQSTYPYREVIGAFLEIAEPSIPEAIQAAIDGGAKEIFVLPLMFFPGRHVRDDIPKYIQEAREKHLDIDFHYGGPLSDHPLMLDVVEAKAKSIKAG